MVNYAVGTFFLVMKIQVINTPTGFVPYGDDEYDKKAKLKIGEEYTIEVKTTRNAAFHRKYFKLIKLSWEYLNEAQQKFFHNNIEVFRKTMEVQAGHCELVYSIQRREWVESPKSIAFDKMSEEEFAELYERVKDALFEIVLKNVDEEEFFNVLMYF